MQKLASFDLEIAQIMEEGDYDWKAKRPLGITCAAIMLSHDDERGRFLTHYTNEPRLVKDECQMIVFELISLVKDGYTIVTVNGAGFDFDVLAEESGLYAECADLALHYHCDLMLMSVCHLGWRTGLQAFAEGAGVEAKLKEVELADGRILSGMDGAKAPEMWAAGEHEAVLAYLKQDVKATLETAETAVERGVLGWYSSKGKWWEVPLPFERNDGYWGTEFRLPIVAECLGWPRPDTSWMSDPPNPKKICGWALEEVMTID